MLMNLIRHCAQFFPCFLLTFRKGLRLFLLGLILFYGLPATMAQTDNGEIDSLEQVLQMATKDTTKMNALSLLGEKLKYTNPPDSEKYRREYLRLAQKSKDIIRIAAAMQELATFYIPNNYDSVRIISLKNLALIREANNEKLNTIEARVLFQLAIVKNYEGQFDEALAYYEQARQKIGTESASYTILHNIAMIKAQKGDLAGALEDYTEVKDYCIREGHSDFEAKATYNIAFVYQEMGEKEKSIEYYQKAIRLREKQGNERAILWGKLSIANFDLYDNPFKALQQYHPILKRSKALNNEVLTVWALRVMTKAYWNLNDLENALKYAFQRYDIVKHYSLENEKRNISLFFLARIYNLKKEYPIALKYAQQAIDGFRIKGGTDSEHYAEALHELATALQFTGSYKAAWDIIAAKDSIVAKRNTELQKTELAKAEVKLQLREKELAYENKEKEKELQITKIEGEQNLLLSILGALGIIFILGFFAYRRVQAANKTIDQQKDSLTQSLQEKEVLLKEIHHRVKNNLQIISNLMAKQARKTTDETVKKMMQEGQDRVQSMALIHQNLYQSDNLSEIDMKAYLEELTDNIARTQTTAGKTIALQLDIDDSKLDIDTAIPLGLILNEVITNAYKYAFADKDEGEIAIVFKKIADQKSLLQIKDNGIGMPDNFSFKKAKSLGLNLVQGLVQQLDGTMQLDGKDGTAFELVF